MPPDGERLDAALGELLAAVTLDRGPVLTVPLPPDLTAADAAALVDALLARTAPAAGRAAFCGDGVVFCGVGAALTLRDPEAIAPAVAAAADRRLVVTLPFHRAPPDECMDYSHPKGVRIPAAAPPSSSWRRHRARVAVAPRLWLHHRDGAGLLGVDLGRDDSAARREARQLLERWRGGATSRPPVSLEVESGATSPDEAGHRWAVGAALDEIADGRLQKVVLARRRRLRLRGTPGDLALALWRASSSSAPEEVRFLLDLGGDAFVGVTPERLCRRRGRRLEVDVLAGTAPLDDAGLLEDDKERREHEAVRRFVEDTLRPVATRLDAPTRPGLRRLRQLQHLHTPVRADLVDDAPVFLRLHPTPAVAGLPRDVALATIAGLEGFDRGLYAGGIGVVDGDGEDLRVALRCAHVVADDEGADVDLYVGSGLVAGSDPAREWQELERKEQTMRAAVDAVLGRR